MPESDFVLAAFIEEWGLLRRAHRARRVRLPIIFRILSIANSSGRNFEKYICLGAAIMFTLQFLINSASATGLLPVVGIPFPFLSYGGSGLVANFVVLSLVDFVRRSK